MVVNQYFPSQVILKMGKFELFSSSLGMKHQPSLAPMFGEMDKVVRAYWSRIGSGWHTLV